MYSTWAPTFLFLSDPTSHFLLEYGLRWACSGSSGVFFHLRDILFINIMARHSPDIYKPCSCIYKPSSCIYKPTSCDPVCLQVNCIWSGPPVMASDWTKARILPCDWPPPRRSKFQECDSHNLLMSPSYKNPQQDPVFTQFVRDSPAPAQHVHSTGQ